MHPKASQLQRAASQANRHCRWFHNLGLGRTDQPGPPPAGHTQSTSTTLAAAAAGQREVIPPVARRRQHAPTQPKHAPTYTPDTPCSQLLVAPDWVFNARTPVAPGIRNTDTMTARNTQSTAKKSASGLACVGGKIQEVTVCLLAGLLTGTQATGAQHLSLCMPLPPSLPACPACWDSLPPVPLRHRFLSPPPTHPKTHTHTSTHQLVIQIYKG